MGLNGSLNQRFKRMHFLLVGLSILIAGGYLYSLKLVNNAKKKYQDSVTTIKHLNEAEKNHDRNTINLLAMQVSPSRKMLETIQKNSQAIRRAMSDAKVLISDQNSLAFLSQAIEAQDNKVTPALTEFSNLIDTDVAEATQFYNRKGLASQPKLT